MLWLQGAGPSAFDDIVTYGSALATIKVPDAHAPSKLVRWFAGNADPEGVLPPPFGRTKIPGLVGDGKLAALAGRRPLDGLAAARPSGQGGFVDWSAAGRFRAGSRSRLPGLFWQHYYLLPTPGVALVVAVAIWPMPGD